jgi:hypothetical protein
MIGSNNVLRDIVQIFFSINTVIKMESYQVLLIWIADVVTTIIFACVARRRVDRNGNGKIDYLAAARHFGFVKVLARCISLKGGNVGLNFEPKVAQHTGIQSKV